MDKNESTTNALDIMMVNAVQKKDNTFLKRLAQFLYDQNRIGAANAVETLRRNSFPVSLKEEAILVEARQYETLLRLIGIKVSQSTAWKLAKVFKAYQRKKGKFNISDATAIKAEAEKIFGDEHRD